MKKKSNIKKFEYKTRNKNLLIVILISFDRYSISPQNQLDYHIHSNSDVSTAR